MKFALACISFRPFRIVFRSSPFNLKSTMDFIRYNPAEESLLTDAKSSSDEMDYEVLAIQCVAFPSIIHAYH